VAAIFRVIDLRDLLDEKGAQVELPAPARRLREQVGRIVQAATVRAAGREATAAVRCRRRPMRRACPGPIRVLRLDLPEQIRWCCAGCGEEGCITHWLGSYWDLSRAAASEPPESEQPRARALLTLAEYGALAALETLDDESECVIAGARPVRHGVELEGSLDYMDGVLGFVAAAANHAERRARQAILYRVYERVEAALRRTDPEAPKASAGSDFLSSLLLEQLARCTTPQQRRGRPDRAKQPARAARGANRTRGSAADPGGSIYQLEIALEDVEPRVWRRIQVASDTTLGQLHAVIQAAMDWTDSHLHLFESDGVRYGVPDPDDELPMRDERRVRLRDVAQSASAELAYLYDFGDGWRHRVRVEEVLPPDPALRYPRCIAGERTCPPEDVGGPPGYMTFLEAVLDPRHPEHRETLTWVGGAFDPEACDLRAVNARLRTAKR